MTQLTDIQLVLLSAASQHVEGFNPIRERLKGGRARAVGEKLIALGFSVRVGAELDVIVSASGRVLLAFQADETRQFRVEESVRRRPEHADIQIGTTLDLVRARGFESIPSVQVRGLYAVAFPILNTRGNAIAALTVPYAERIDLVHRKPVAMVEELLGIAARELSIRIDGSPDHTNAMV